MSNPGDPFTAMFQQMLASGSEMARAMNPALEKFDLKAFEKMIPTVPPEVMELWWGKTVNRDGLDAKTRLYVALSGLVTQGALAEPQIRLTVRQLLAQGATQREIAEAIFTTGMFAGMPAMQKGLELAQSVFAEETKA